MDGLSPWRVSDTWGVRHAARWRPSLRDRRRCCVRLCSAEHDRPTATRRPTDGHIGRLATRGRAVDGLSRYRALIGGVRHAGRWCAPLRAGEDRRRYGRRRCVCSRPTRSPMLTRSADRCAEWRAGGQNLTHGSHTDGPEFGRLADVAVGKAVLHVERYRLRR